MVTKVKGLPDRMITQKRMWKNSVRLKKDPQRVEVNILIAREKENSAVYRI